MKINIAMSQPYENLSSFGSIGWQVPMQQYSLFFVKLASPSQISSLVQGVPPFSSHVFSDTLNFSGVLPFGRTNMLSGISRVFCFPYWVYVMLMFPWKWPGVSGDSVRVRLWIPLADMFSIGFVSMNEMLDVVLMFVIGSSPKLNSWIVSWVSVSVKSSARRSSGSS